MSRRRTRRLTRVGLVALPFLTVLLFTFDGRSGRVPANPAALPTVSSIMPLPRSVEAGSTIDIEFGATNSAGTLDLLVISAAGSTTSTIDIENDGSGFVLGPPHTLRAGTITLGLDFGAGPHFETIEVIPGTRDLLVDLNVGPTAIRRSEAAMAVGLLTDSWGNPVPDGSPLRTTVTQANGESEIVELPTRRGLVVLEVTGDADSERFTIAMDSSTVFSPSVDVIVQPGTPLPFDLVRNSNDPLLADARSLIELRSSDLVDDGGWAITDGTNIVLNVTGPDGPGIAHGEVVDGVLQATLIAPAEPGLLTVTASIRGRTSPALVLDFAPAAVTFPVEFEVTNGRRHVVIGPVIGPDGGLLPDGTPVNIGNRTTVLVDGHAEVSVPPGNPTPTITVLGVPGAFS